jgi:hypothetical protein
MVHGFNYFHKKRIIWFVVSASTHEDSGWGGVVNDYWFERGKLMARVHSTRIKCVLSPCDPFKRNQSVILYDGVSWNEEY